MPKLPKNLPALPPVPEGYARWEYKGMGWDNNGKPCEYACLGLGWDAWEITPSISHRPSGAHGMHYAVAVRDPKPAPTIRKSGKVAPKKRERRVVAKLVDENPNLIRSLADLPSGDGPVYVLPADAKSVARMVEQVLEGIYADAKRRYPAWTASREQMDNFASHARAALAAIGIKAKGGSK